jgi:hypothetical protein
MPRRALQLVIIAALAFAGLVLAYGALTVWLRPALAPPPPVDISTLNEVQAGSAALPLDANGIGTQVVGGVALTYRLEPAAPRSGQPVTLTLAAFDLRSGQLVPVTPTLTVAVAGSTSATAFAFARLPDGGYRTQGVLFPTSAKWRLRTSLWLDGKPDYVTLIDVNVN